MAKKVARKTTKNSKVETSLKAGDKVEWSSSQGKTKGVVKRKITGSSSVQGHQVKASRDEPQFLVESKKTGQQAAHKAKALKKVKS